MSSIVPHSQGEIGRSQKIENVRLVNVFVRTARNTGQCRRNVSHRRREFESQLIAAKQLSQPPARVGELAQVTHDDVLNGSFNESIRRWRRHLLHVQSLDYLLRFARRASTHSASFRMCPRRSTTRPTLPKSSLSD